MSHTILFIAYALVVLGAVAVILWAAILKTRKKDLDKWEVSLAERFNNLSDAQDALIADQKTFENKLKAFKPFFNGTAVELSASYAVSDSDYNKYKNETAIKNVARNRIAHNIAFDIIKKFPEPNYENGVYSYKFKVMEGK